MMRPILPLTALVAFGIAQAASAEECVLHSFKKQQLTDKFWSEGAHTADFNRDGKGDIVSGPFWYAGPDFQKRHEIWPPTEKFKVKAADGTEQELEGYPGALSGTNAYSNDFLTYTHDLNADGWTDVIIYGWPGKPALWYENPREAGGHWKGHEMIPVLDNESPMWADITGDGKPEIVCNSTINDQGHLGYATADANDPTKPWTFHKISPAAKKYHKYTHGVGYGDVNGDGRADLLEAEGWWEQPASLAGDPEWKFNPVKFGKGGCQMYAYDVNGDGLNDIITTIEAHGYGMAWFEQYQENGERKFREHLFLGKEPKDTKYGVHFSQPHAIDLVDMDGDGLKDLVTGKRFWAHGPSGDPEPNAAAVLYWFRLVRGKDKDGGAEFVPYLIDDNSGVGTQVTAADVNGDKLPDIVVGNKKGTFVFLHETRKVSREEWEKAQPKPAAGS